MDLYERDECIDTLSVRIITELLKNENIENYGEHK